MRTSGSRDADSGRETEFTAPQPSPRADIRLAWLAGKQAGVVSLGQIYDLGLNYAQVKWRVETGHLHPLHRGVYAVGHHRVSNHGVLLGALMATGPSSFLSHRTAAAHWGLRVVNRRAIELTVVAGRTSKRAGLTLHRTRSAPEQGEVVRQIGLRVSSVPRMLVDLAPRETPAELDRLITQAVRKRLLKFDALEETLSRHARRPGITKLKAALRDYRRDTDTSSNLELSFDAAIVGTEIPPPQCNIHIDGWEIDRFWPEHEVALELDGRPYHTAVKDMERDRIKDLQLQLKGIKPFRVTDLRWELDPCAALDDLRALLNL